MQVIAHKKFIKKFCTSVSSQMNCPIFRYFLLKIYGLTPFCSTFAGKRPGDGLRKNREGVGG